MPHGPGSIFILLTNHVFPEKDCLRNIHVCIYLNFSRQQPGGTYSTINYSAEVSVKLAALIPW